MKPQEWHKLLEDVKTTNRKLLTHRLIRKDVQGWGEGNKNDDEILSLNIDGDTVQIHGQTLKPSKFVCSYKWITGYHKDEHQYVDFSSYIKLFKWISK